MSPKLKPSFISIFSLNTDSFQNLQYINTDYGLKTHQNLIKKTRLSSRFSIDFSVFDHIIRFKPETHYRCRRVAAAQRHVCAVTKACRCVATALPANSLPHMKSLGRWQNIFKMASFEEALINSFRMFAVLYDMSLKDYKNEKVKGNAWEKITEEMRVIGFNVSGRLTFCSGEILL